MGVGLAVVQGSCGQVVKYGNNGCVRQQWAGGRAGKWGSCREMGVRPLFRTHERHQCGFALSFPPTHVPVHLLAPLSKDTLSTPACLLAAGWALHLSHTLTLTLSISLYPSLSLSLSLSLSRVHRAPEMYKSKPYGCAVRGGAVLRETRRATMRGA